MKGTERAALRAEAHHLSPTVHVGQHGLSPTLIASLDDTLRTHELVKVKFSALKDQKKLLSPQLATLTNSRLIMRVGNVVVLHRPRPESEAVSPGT